LQHTLILQGDAALSSIMERLAVGLHQAEMGAANYLWFQENDRSGATSPCDNEHLQLEMNKLGSMRNPAIPALDAALYFWREKM
jgi:hypothetical protein